MREQPPSEPPRPGHQWVKTDLDLWVQEPVRRKSGQTPHAKLKAACRDALIPWRLRTGCNLVLLPSIVGKVNVRDGTRQGKEIAVGRKGQADDTLLVGCKGQLLGVLGLEYKAGADRQSEAQVAFQVRWERAGGVYVVVRSVEDMTDALDQMLAQGGRLF